MSRRSTALLKAALSALHYSRADGLLAPLTRGIGVIFTLHHVRPEPPRPFEPNRILVITPDFLERVIELVVESGFDVIGLDDVPGRIAAADPTRPFAAFTFDDGYRDNARHALPIFKRHNLPFAIYVPTDFPDGTGELWWLAFEAAIRVLAEIEVEMHGERRVFSSRTLAEKDSAFHHVYWWLRSIPEPQARAVVRSLAAQAGVSIEGLCRDLVMTWDEIRAMAQEPLVTFGAHTCGHFALGKLDAETARREVEGSIRRLELELGRPCHHFSYPYGCEASAGEREFRLLEELGMATAVTTRKGLIQAHHRAHLTGLPRVSLNGDYQDERFVKVMLSGLPFAFWNGVQRLVRPHAAA